MTQCSSGEYLACNWAGYANNVVCFDTEGNILWEEGFFSGGGHCRGSGHQGIERLSPDRYVSWDSCESGVYLDCFDTDGTILWRQSFGANLEELHVSDVISNSDGGVIILGVRPNMLVKMYDWQMLLVILTPIGIIGIIAIAVVVLSPGWRKAYQASRLARVGSRRASYEEWVHLTSSKGGKEQG